MPGLRGESVYVFPTLSLVSMSMNASGGLQKVGNVYQLNIEPKVYKCT